MLTIYHLNVEKKLPKKLLKLDGQRIINLILKVKLCQYGKKYLLEVMLNKTPKVPKCPF